MIFIDRSIPKPVAEALKLVRNDILLVGGSLHHGVKDPEWLAVAGANGWLVIVRDKKIRTRPAERQAIIDNGVSCFILNQSSNPTKWEYLKLLALTLDDMTARFEIMAKPFVFTVNRAGEMRQVLH